MRTTRLAIRRLLASLALLVAASTASAQEPLPGPWSPDDWRILEETVRWADASRLDTLPPGALAARIGERFVGAPYRGGTLEAGPPERVVVNLREFDCVTYVESVLALARFVHRDGVAALADPGRAQARFEGYLRELRYRDGRLDGYTSRLHYFSEWLAQHAREGRLRLVTLELGGGPDTSAIDFMTSHAAAYPALADPATRRAIREVEQGLSRGPPRYVLPKAEITAAEGAIGEGDVIAATATEPGLDVVHTGFAVWRDGRLHLMHAPLAGGSIEVSALPLAERIQRIRTQDGIMVARLLEP